MVVTGERTTAEQPPSDSEKSVRRFPGGTRGTVAALLAASWIVPAAANALHADVILLPLLLVGTASLLRAGHTLLDRLVIAAAFLAGLLIAAGVLFSFWPWHLSPVPVAGFCFSVLTLIGAAIGARYGRRPALPKRVRGTDLIILVAPVVAWILLRAPIRGKSFIASLPYIAPRHDTFNHYSLYDAIHHVGGYPFFLSKPSAPYIADMMGYQPGMHYLYVLLDIFRRSTTDPGGSISEYQRYGQYEALGFCLLTIAVPWAARWIAGPSVTGWRRTLVVSSAAAFAVFGQLSTLFWQAFDAEVLGLSLVAVLTAVVARPPRSVREQVVLTGALVTAVAFVYGLFLANAAIVVGVGFIVHRERITRDRATRDFTIRAAFLTVGFSMIPTIFDFGLLPIGDVFTMEGGFIDFSRSLSVGLGLIVIGAVLTRTGRRSPVWRVSSAVTAGSCAIAVVGQLWGHVASGSPQYYSSKLVESAWVTTICGLGSLALFLKNDVARADRRVEIALGTAALALPVILANGVPLSAHIEHPGDAPAGTSFTVLWSWGQIVPSYAPALAAYARVGTFGDGVPTVVALSTPRRNVAMTMFVSALNHHLGSAELADLDPSALIELHLPPDQASQADSFALLNTLAPNADARPLSRDADDAMKKVEVWLRSQTKTSGMRVAVANQAFARLLERFAAQEPQRHLSVLYVPGVPK